MTTYKILVIDDAFFIRNLIKKAVAKKPLKNDVEFEIVGEAQNGSEGLELCKELNPDIITIDFNMPELDGLAFAKYLKEINPRIPILMVSSNPDPTFPQQVEEIGCQFLQKPFQEAYLWMRLDSLVKEIQEFDESSVTETVSEETKDLLKEIEMEVEAELEENNIELEEVSLPKVNQSTENTSKKKKKKKKKPKDDLFGLEIDDSFSIPIKVEKKPIDIKPVNTEKVEETTVKPIEPVKQVEPIKPIEPVNQVKPIIPVKPIERTNKEEVLVKPIVAKPEIILNDTKEEELELEGLDEFDGLEDIEFDIDENSDTTMEEEQITAIVDDEEILIDEDDEPLIIDDNDDIIIIEDEDEIIIEDDDEVIEFEEEDENEILIEEDEEDEEDTVEDEFNVDRPKIGLNIKKKEPKKEDLSHLSEKELKIRKLMEDLNYSYQNEMSYMIHVVGKNNLQKETEEFDKQITEETQDNTPVNTLGINEKQEVKEEIPLVIKNEDEEFDELFAEFNPTVDMSNFTSNDEELHQYKEELKKKIDTTPSIVQKIEIEPPRSEKVKQIYKSTDDSEDMFIVHTTEQKESIFTKIFNIFSKKK